MQPFYPALKFSTPEEIAQQDAANPDRLPTNFTQDMVRYGNIATDELESPSTETWLSRRSPLSDPSAGSIGPYGPVYTAPSPNWDDNGGVIGDTAPQPEHHGGLLNRLIGGVKEAAREITAPARALAEVPFTPFSADARDDVADAFSDATRLLSRPAAAVRSYLASPDEGSTIGFGPALPSRPREAAARGFVEPDEAPTGMDIGAVQHLPDSGPEFGPVHITPRTVAGAVYDAATDPLSYAPLGEGSRALRSGADEAAPAAERFGAAVGGGAARDAESMLSPDAAGSASQRLFGIKAPEPGLSSADEALNWLKRTIGVGVPEEDVATPIMRERARVKQIVDSQSARMGAVADDVTRVFEADRAGRITALPGQPTIQDVAARLPQYAPYLSNDQRLALAKLRAEVEPFSDALMENGIDLRSRADVQDGGFYLPRGNAGLEGADEPLKVGTGRGGAGGKKGFERGAAFDSMAEGIDAGYRYAPFRDAIQSYAKQAGDRAIDAYATNAFKASGLGEGVKDRLMRENPSLVSEWDQVNHDLASVRGRLATAEQRAGVSGGRVDELDRAFADVARAQPEGGAAPLARVPTELRNLKAEGNDLFYDDPLNRDLGLGMDKVVQRLESLVPDGTERVRFLDTAIARTQRRIDVLAQRGGGYTQQAKDLRAELGTLQAHYDGIAPEYRRAFEHAQATPREQGSIGFAGLNGTTFPDEVANVANKYLNAEKKATGTGTTALNTVAAFNGLMRGLRASLDVSFMAIQGLLGAASHPIAYGKALGVALKSLADDRALGAFISHFDETAQAAGRLDSRGWAAHGARIGGSDTEFSIGKGVAKIGPALQGGNIPGTSLIPGLREGLNPIRGSNRAFGTFGDALRLLTDDALYKARQSAGRTLSPDEIGEIAHFGNLMTGYANWRVGGDVGALAEFAPRFFASQLELAARAMGGRGIAADEARKSLVELIGIGTAITVGANEARGYETDFKPGSPNFMRIRNVAGTDVSLFGPWDSLVRGVVYAGKGDFSYMARSKASPAVALAWDYLSGESFLGERTRDTPQQAVEYFLKQLVPFSASGPVNGEPLSSAAIGVTGLKATPLSNTERVQMGDFKTLNAANQFKALSAQSWKLLHDSPSASPAIKAELEKYPSFYEWYAATADEYERQARERGANPADARVLAERATQGHPYYKAYQNAKDHLETQWIIDHPKEARAKFEEQSALPQRDRTWMPTKEQRALIDKLTATATPTASGTPTAQRSSPTSAPAR